MKKTLYYVITICFLSMAGRSLAASSGMADLPDSLLTAEHIYEFTFSDQEKALKIIRLMRERKLEAEFRLDIAEGDLYFNNGKYKKGLVCYERALKSDSVRNNDGEYMEMLHRMISSYDCLHDAVKKAEYVELLLKKAESCGNKEMQSIACFNMGKMIYYQEDKERGYRMITEAIALMKRSDYTYKYDNLRYNYHTLLIMQQRDKRYADALETLDKLKEIVTESDTGEPDIDELEKKEWKTLYAQRAIVLLRLGRVEEADNAYRAWQAIGKAYSKDDYLIVPYLMERKKFTEVIGIYEPRERFLKVQKDTINYHMMTVKRSLAKAYQSLGDYPKAAVYFEQLYLLTDSLKVREQHSAAMELATVYETHKQEAEINDQASRLKVRNILLGSSVILIFSLLLLLFRNHQYTRTIRCKNAAMIHTIEELLAYKDELFEKKTELRMVKQENIQDADCEREACRVKSEELEETSDEISGNSFESDDKIAHRNKLLFQQLDEIVVRDKLYLNPDLSREELMKKIGVNKNLFGQIIQQSTGTNITVYINNKRLEYAARQLRLQRTYTITAIAQSCGIPNIPTFNRLFKSKFGMTPTEFREGMEMPK